MGQRGKKRRGQNKGEGQRTHLGSEAAPTTKSNKAAASTPRLTRISTNGTRLSLILLYTKILSSTSTHTLRSIAVYHRQNMYYTF